MTKSSVWPVWFEECGFDGTTIAVDGSSSDSTNVTYCDFNAYLSSTTNHLPVTWEPTASPSPISIGRPAIWATFTRTVRN